jgi:hypothetical protein
MDTCIIKANLYFVLSMYMFETYHPNQFLEKFEQHSPSQQNSFMPHLYSRYKFYLYCIAYACV